MKKKIWSGFTTVLVVLFAALAVTLAGVRLLGLQVFSVLSGSMEPEYHVGSLIYVKKVDYRELEAGDVITYLMSEDTVSTHRIVKVIADDEDPEVLRFATKGDANEAVDGTPVHYKNVIGMPVFSIPYLGYLASYISSPPGSYVAISAVALLISLMFLPDIFAQEEPQKQGKHLKPPQKH